MVVRDPVTGIGDHAAELAVLWPALAAALERDTAADGTVSGGIPGASAVFNADVLAARLALGEQVPATTREACEVLGERWLPRDVPGCLRQLPRLIERLHQCGYCWLCGHEKQSPSPVSVWRRVTKRALGMWKPDLPLPGCPLCPHVDTRPENHVDAAPLLTAGEEGFLEDGPAGLHVRWVTSGQIYCPSRLCGASWPQGQWRLLGRMLGAAAVA